MKFVEELGLSAVGMNSLIGDFTSFFFTAGIMACIGAYRNEYVWLYGTISLLGSAAIFRTSADLFHNAEIIYFFVQIEVVVSLLLLLCVYKMKTDS